MDLQTGPLEDRNHLQLSSGAIVRGQSSRVQLSVGQLSGRQFSSRTIVLEPLKYFKLLNS